MKILSLFDRSGVMVAPWHNAGHSILTVDIDPARHDMPSMQIDIFDFQLPFQPDIVFAFPPCTHLARSGARWWKTKPPEALEEALKIVQRTRSICDKSNHWMIENPVGRLNQHWRYPDWQFDPYEYAGYAPADQQTSQRYTKKTCIWASFSQPLTRPLFPILGNSPIMSLGPSPERAYLRSITPVGFATAVYEHLSKPFNQLALF